MKKSYYLFLLLLVAATSFSVHAQTGQKFPDFKLGVSSKLQTNGMQKVNPNEEKEKGILMYATTLDDYSIKSVDGISSGQKSLKML